MGAIAFLILTFAAAFVWYTTKELVLAIGRGIKSLFLLFINMFRFK